MADEQQSAAPVVEQPAVSEEIAAESPETEQELSHDSEKSIDADKSLTKEQKAEEKRKLKAIKLKIDGKEITEDLPFEFDENPEAEEYLRKQLQLAKVSQKRMSEYSQLEKDVQNFVELLRKDPEKALSDPTLGVDVEKFVQRYVEKKLEESQKSPEQLEKEKLEAELKSLKDRYEAERKAAEEKEFERLREQEVERYDLAISSALEKSDLPKSPYVIKKMANYMLLGVQNGIDVNPSDVLPLVKDEIQQDIKDMFAVMPDEVVEALVGKDTITRIRKKSIAKAKQAAPVAPSQIKDVGASEKREASEDDKKKQTYKDFFGF